MAVPKNRGLGKGLEALFNSSEIDTKEISIEKTEESEQKGISFIDINEIKPCLLYTSRCV